MSVAWVGAGIAAVSAISSYSANKKAAKSQEEAARQANDTSSAASQAALEENRRQYDLNRSDIMPTIERGNLAGNRLQELMGLGTNTGANGYGSLTNRFTGADLATDPGYQFGLQQGQRGLDNSASAHGGYYSGAQLKAASRYNNDYAGTKFNDAYNRYNTDQSNLFNRYSGIAGSGQQAVTQIGQQGANMANINGQIGINNANTVGNNLMDAANARSSSYLAQNNSLQNALNQGLSAWKRTQNKPPNVGSTSGGFGYDYGPLGG
jgi:hypothetical protein